MCKYTYNPERNYPKGTAFTYKLSWTELDLHYYGVRFRKGCHPDDIWKTYFTSSKKVWKLRKCNIHPDIIKIDYIFDTKYEAIEYEYNYILENNCVKDPKWLNLNNGGKKFCCEPGKIVINNSLIQKIIDPEELHLYLDQGWIQKGLPKTEEHKKNISKGKLGKPKSEEEKLNMSKARKGIPKSEEYKKNLSESMLAKGYKRSEETKAKMRGHIKSEENKKILSDLYSGTIYINDGIKQKRIKPEDFILYDSEIWKKGMLLTEEQRQNFTESNKGTIYISKDNICKRIKKEFMQEYLDQGWELKRLKRLSNKSKIKRIWINDGITNKLIPEDDYINYPEWKLGSKPINRK